MVLDRPLFGVALMFAFCALAPVADAFAKLLGESLPLLTLLLVRFAAQALLVAPFAAGALGRVSPRVLRVTLLRTALQLLGSALFVLALRYLPLADAVAIAFVMPFVLLLLGRLLLGETVGPRRLAACAVGFAGTLMVVQPSFAEVGWPALLPFAAAFVFAAYMLLTRMIAKEIDALALQLLSGLMATPALLAVWLAFGGFAFDLTLVLPGGREALLLFGAALVGTLAHLVMTLSLRFAPSATLAPMQYLEIPFATFVGWVVFGDLPDGLAAAGILVTVAAGLSVVALERRAAGRAARAA